MAMLRIRRLSESGLTRMVDFLDSFDSAMPWAIDEAHRMLTAADTSEALPNPVEVDGEHVFAHRLELAEYLYARIPRLGLRDATRDPGLWAWLALLWFDQLCPAKRGGSRSPGEHYRYIPRLDDYRTYYRHRILGPYLIYSAHRDDPARALCMLCQPPAIHPDTAEQLASRQDMIRSPALIGAATALYYDPNKGTVRRGSTTYKGKQPRAGTLRRLVDVFWQLDRTYDHLACTANSFMTLLPIEFSQFVDRSKE